MGESGPPYAWFPGPTRVHTPNDISTGTAVLVQLMFLPNRHTHIDKHTQTYIDHAISVVIVSVACDAAYKAKCAVPHEECRRGAHLPSLGRERAWKCDARPRLPIQHHRPPVGSGAAL